MVKDWPACRRIVHLSGGINAISEPQCDLVTLWPNSIDNKTATIRISTFGKLYSALEKLNLKILGVDFITHYSEAIGKVPMQFRGYVEQERIWPNWDAKEKWSGLALSSFHNKNGLAYDLSNRISYQLNTVNNRLRTLSLSYQNQLNSVVLKDDFRHEKRFQNGFTDLVYQEFHSFLFDACILRDYLCEYIYNFSSNGVLKDGCKEVTTASGLFKCLNKTESLSKLEAELKYIMSKDGWLFELGQYRDLVMHSAPINIANSQLYAIQEAIVLPDNKEIISVRFPLPDNPSLLYSERCKRNDFDKYIRQFKELNQMSLNNRGKYDCLEYAHMVFGLLSNLSVEVAEVSPYRPMQQKYILTKSGTISVPEYIDKI
jgi:hypothetical protein